VGDGKLKDMFPRLYGISVFKDRMVSEFGVWREIEPSQDFIWQIPWKRELFDWEKDLEKQLLKLINTINRNGDMTDQWCWDGVYICLYSSIRLLCSEGGTGRFAK